MCCVQGETEKTVFPFLVRLADLCVIITRHVLCLVGCPLSALRPLTASLGCSGSVLEVAADSGGSESLTLVLVFTPEAAAFEVGLRELLRSVSVTSNVSLICADGGGEHVLPFFF